MFNSNVPQGSYRQKSSGALIFPVPPAEKKLRNTQEELDQKLEEVVKMKKEVELLLDKLNKASEE